LRTSRRRCSALVSAHGERRSPVRTNDKRARVVGRIATKLITMVQRSARILHYFNCTRSQFRDRPNGGLGAQSSHQIARRSRYLIVSLPSKNTGSVQARRPSESMMEALT
jgi:hypothetical protein